MFLLSLISSSCLVQLPLVCLHYLLSHSLQDTAVPIVHYIGAFLVFGFGVLYGWGQTLMSIKLFRAGHTPFMWRLTIVIRLVHVCGTTVFFVT